MKKFYFFVFFTFFLVQWERKNIERGISINVFQTLERLEDLFPAFDVEHHEKHSFSLLTNEEGMLGETILVVIDETGIFTYRHPFKGHSDITTLEEYHMIESHYSHIEDYSRFRREESLKTPLLTINKSNGTCYRTDGFINGFSEEIRGHLEKTLFRFLSSLIELAA